MTIQYRGYRGNIFCPQCKEYKGVYQCTRCNQLGCTFCDGMEVVPPPGGSRMTIVGVPAMTPAEGEECDHIVVEEDTSFQRPGKY